MRPPVRHLDSVNGDSYGRHDALHSKTGRSGSECLHCPRVDTSQVSPGISRSVAFAHFQDI